MSARPVELEAVFAALLWVILLTITWVWIVGVPFGLALPIAAAAGGAAALVGVVVTSKLPEDPGSLRRHKLVAGSLLSATAILGTYGAAELSCCEPVSVGLALIGGSLAGLISYRLGWLGAARNANGQKDPSNRTSPWRLGWVGLPGVLTFGLLFALSPERWLLAIVGPVAGAMLGGTIRLVLAEPARDH
ncbi:MAG: hypothetical protein ACRDVL_06515 [Acidimicrobiia bacterium]